MSNRKYTCGTILPSGCVLYTGNFPDFIDSENLDCDLNLDDILEQYGTQLDSILASLDFTGLDKKCYDFTPATVKAKELHQLHINKVCDLEDRLDDLETLVTELNIGSKLITIDLDCLTPAAAPCAQGTNTYSLLSILQILVNEICEIKSQLT